MKIVLLADSLGFGGGSDVYCHRLGGTVVAVKDVDTAEKALNAMMSAETRKA